MLPQKTPSLPRRPTLRPAPCCQVATLSDDAVLRLWDLRTHKCVQALGKADWARPEDARPSAIAYDRPRHRLVT